MVSGTGEGVVSGKIDAIKNKPGTLHQESRNGDLRSSQKLARPYPSQAQRCLTRLISSLLLLCHSGHSIRPQEVGESSRQNDRMGFEKGSFTEVEAVQKDKNNICLFLMCLRLLSTQLPKSADRNYLRNLAEHSN